MLKIIKYTAEEKHAILKAYEDGFWSMRKIASMYQINKSALEKWRYRFGRYGIDGLREPKIRCQPLLGHTCYKVIVCLKNTITFGIIFIYRILERGGCNEFKGYQGHIFHAKFYSVNNGNCCME